MPYKLELNRQLSCINYLILLILGFFFLLVDAKNLPDYEAYAVVYKGFIPRANWEVAFVAINHFCSYLGLTYEQFRSVIFIFSFGSLCYLFKRLSIYQLLPSRLPILFLNYIFFILVISIYIFEFFVILIRSGLAIALVSLGIALALTCNKTFFKTFFYLSGLLLAFYVHKSTAVILFLMLSTITLPSTPLLQFFKIPGHRGFVFISVITSSLLYYLVLTQGQERLGQEISPLNIFRIISIAIIPIAIFFINKQLRRNTEYSAEKHNIWAENFESFYCIFSAGLPILYILGLTSTSGLVLVRLFDLAVFPALVAAISSGNILRTPLSAYLLFANACFFLATLNMFPDFVLKILYLLGKT